MLRIAASEVPTGTDHDSSATSEALVAHPVAYWVAVDRFWVNEIAAESLKGSHPHWHPSVFYKERGDWDESDKSGGFRAGVWLSSRELAVCGVLASEGLVSVPNTHTPPSQKCVYSPQE